MIEFDYMKKAISLAKLGKGKTNPNPLVGAVIVKNGKIIGEGYHEKYGELHAERNAIKDALSKGNDITGADIYVTLEPCAHFGKQPPCCHALVEYKIKRVFVGSRDPNPLVSGKGNSYLRENGIEVIEDFLKDECDKLNPVFFHYITKKIPYVALKYAMTMDGRISLDDGTSKWITNEKSRNYVHELRNLYSGILCGINTVQKDNPLLNCRIPNGKNPVRIILDSHLSIDENSQIVQTSKEIKTIIACTDFDENKKMLLENSGINILLCKPKNNTVDLNDLLKKIGEEKIDSILVEGGGKINSSFLKENLVQKIYTFVGNKILGGNQNKSPVSSIVAESMTDAKSFILEEVKNFDDDVLLIYNESNTQGED